MNILLTGFMGAGKTTVGRKMAKRLGYFFIDTDQEIEKEQACSINDIFKYGGEREDIRKLAEASRKRNLSHRGKAYSLTYGFVLEPRD